MSAEAGGHEAELLANGDLLVAEDGGKRRVTKGTDEHARLVESVAAGEVKPARAPGRFGGPESRPHPTVAELLARLDVSGASRPEQREAASRAAYAGTLLLDELQVLRGAGLIPYDYEAGGEAPGHG